MPLTAGRSKSIEQLRTISGTILCALHPLADDTEIAQTHALLSTVQNTRLLIFRFQVPEGLPKEDFILSESILTDEDSEQIDAFAFGVAQDWHTKIPTPHTAWNALEGVTDTELGWLVEYRLAEVLLQQAKFIATVRRAASHEKPSLLLMPAAWAGALEASLTAGSGCPATGLPAEDSPHTPRIFAESEIAGLRKSLREHLRQIVWLKRGRQQMFLHDSSFFRDAFKRNIEDRKVKVHGLTAFDVFGMINFVRRATWYNPDSRKHARFLARRWEDIQAEGVLEEAFTFQGVTLWGCMRPYIEDLYLSVYPTLIGQLGVRKILLEALRVNGSLMNTDCLLSKKLEILAARKQGISTLVVQHGLKGESNGERPIFADHAAVWGEAARDWHLGFGNDPTQVHITGNPKYDGINRPTEQLPSGPKEKILFAAQVAPLRSAYDAADEERHYAQTAVQVFRQFPDEKFVVKLHPRQSDAIEAYYHEACRDLPHVEITRETPIDQLLAEARLLITESSTVGFEAALLGVPILTVNLTRRADAHPFGRGGVAVSVRNESDWVCTLADLLSNRNATDALRARQADFIAKHLGPMDGKASERLFQLCLRLTSS